MMSNNECDANIKVCVRLRPNFTYGTHSDGSPSKLTQNGNGIWCLDATATTLQQDANSSYAYADTSKSLAYQFDQIYDHSVNTQTIYEDTCKSVVIRSMEGYHGSVFSYGQTATGKTFTMQGTHTTPGVVPLAVEDCFKYIRESNNREWLLRMSYLEIYNELIFDLLNTNAAGNAKIKQRAQGKLGGAVKLQSTMRKNKEIKIFTERGKGVVIKNLTEPVVVSEEVRNLSLSLHSNLLLFTLN